MSEPGQRRFGEDLAPQWALKVGGIDVRGDISKLTQSIEFEHSIDMADMLSLTVNNPYFALTDERNFINYKLFQPGNEAELWVGYGRADTFIGRAILQKHKGVFPRGEIPRLNVKGYDKSFLMMKAAGDLQGAQANKIKLKSPRPEGKQDDQGRSWTNVRHSDIVFAVAQKYAFATDIDATTRIDTIVQKKGMPDYELVKGLASLNNKEFWVDYDNLKKRWTLHWVDSRDTQRAQYAFWYGVGKKTTLLECEIEYGITEPITTLQVLAWDWLADRWVTAVEVESAESADPIFREGTPPRVKGGGDSLTMSELITNASKFRLSAAGISMDVITDHQFKDAEGLAAFAQRWFLERRNNFLIANGQVAGLETLRAGQVHELRGLSKRVDGPFYFVKVKHVLNDTGGYYCPFVARKIIE